MNTDLVIAEKLIDMLGFDVSARFRMVTNIKAMSDHPMKTMSLIGRKKIRAIHIEVASKYYDKTKHALYRYQRSPSKNVVFVNRIEEGTSSGSRCRV